MVLTFLADAEKARVWILEAMNILKVVTVVKLEVTKEAEKGSGEKSTRQKEPEVVLVSGIRSWQLAGPLR